MITDDDEQLFKLFDVPQTIIEIMIVLHTYAFVLLLYVLGAHGGLAYGKGMLFTLCKDRHHHPLLTICHPRVFVS